MAKEKFNNFDDIEHLPLRVYNRAITATNISNDLGRTALTEYIEQFTDIEKKQLAIMFAFIQKYGLKKAQEEATKGIEFTDEQIAV